MSNTSKKKQRLPKESPKINVDVGDDAQQHGCVFSAVNAQQWVFWFFVTLLA